MGVQIVGNKTLLTSSSVYPSQAQYKTSFALKFRFDGDISGLNGLFLFYRMYYAGPTIVLTKNSNNKMSVAVYWYTESGRIDFRKDDVSVGDTHCLASTFDGVSGEQLVYLDGVRNVAGNFIGKTSGAYNRTNQIGGNENNNLTTQCVFSIEDVGFWDGYILTDKEVEDLRDDIKIVSDIGSPFGRIYWPLKGIPGSTVVPNQGGLRNQFSDSLHLSVESGIGSAIYTENMKWKPTSKISEAYISTCGELIGIRCTNLTNAESVIKKIYRLPSLNINGIPIQYTDEPVWMTGFHTSILIPIDKKLKSSDVVTMDVSNGWLETSDGLVAGINNFKLDNRVGKSSHNYNYNSIKRTLPIGVNFSFTGTGSDVPYSIPKNLVKRLGFWSSGTGTTKDGKPTSLILDNYTSSTSEILVYSGDSGVDNTGHPLSYGLHTIGWDDLDLDNPDTWSIVSIYGTGLENNVIITERTDLRNNGTVVNNKRINKARSFNIQPAPGKPNKVHISVKVSNNSKISKSENIYVYGPKDFEYEDGVPVVLDKSNPNALSNVFLDRFSNGAGAFRWMDTITYYMGGSPICDPGMYVDFNDFRWGYNRRLYDKTTRFVEARPYDYVNTYIYSATEGDKYEVVLANAVNEVDTTLQVVWSDDKPIIPRLRLYLPNNDGTEEVVRVISVPENPVDGQTVDISVIRGEEVVINGVTPRSNPRSHNPGIIYAGYRFPAPPMSDLSLGNGLNYILVSDTNHDMWTGIYPQPLGSWPSFTFTDGTVVKPTDGGWRLMVTGPKTVVASQWTPNTTAVTLNSTITLNPSTCYTRLYLPQDGPSFPFDYAAYATGQIKGCDLWLNIPYLASDELVIDIARKCRDKFPSGRNVFIEICNEPWNWGFPQWGYLSVMSRILYSNNGGIGPYGFLVNRSKKVWEIFESIFNEGGRNRGSEIKRTINFQPRASMSGVLNYAKNICRIDACATAPYILIPDGDASYLDHTTSICQFRWNREKCIDLWTHHLHHNVSAQSFPLSFIMQKNQIQSYNLDTGNNCKLVGYEGGVEFPITVKEITPPGTVSVINSSNIVNGTGTDFVKYFYPGQSIIIKERMYKINSVQNKTTLLLTENYGGPSESGLTYKLSSFIFNTLSGTVSVENGKSTVVGNNTLFDQSYVGKILGIRQPDGIMRYGFQPAGFVPYRYFFVKSVEDQTHLTLENNWNGSTSSNCLIYDVEEHCDTKARDMVYDPNWYFVEIDFYKLLQDYFYRMCFFCYGGGYFRGRYMWPVYTHINQDYGRGDGSDGKADNRLYMVEPGLPNSKSPTINKDLISVSVRGKALIDWNKTESIKPKPRRRFIPIYNWFTKR